MPGCRTSRQQRQPEQGSVPAAVRREDLVGDADRERRAGLVGRAFAEGLVDLDEMDRLMDDVFRSRTVGELEAATGVLPDGWVAASRRSADAAHRLAASRAARSAEVRAYLGVMALLVGIWAVTAVAAGATYFWPVWPAVGWGLPLLLGKPGREDVTAPRLGTHQPG